MRDGCARGTMRLMGMGMRTLRDHIDEAIAAGESLDGIQLEILDDAPVSDELRDALWLYAWGLLESDVDPALN